MSRMSGPVRAVKGQNAASAVGGLTSTPQNALVSQSGTREAGNAADALALVGVANSANTVLGTITNAALGQSTTYTLPDPGTAKATFALSSSASVATAPNVFVRVITATQAALASAGQVVVQANTSATSQFVVLGMRVISSTGLSGNSGNRLLSLTDGTKVYNGTGITAALAGTPITTAPGGTGNPDCGTAVDPTASTAGASIYVQYTGGTTDYNAGSIKVQVTLAQVTA